MAKPCPSNGSLVQPNPQHNRVLKFDRTPVVPTGPLLLTSPKISFLPSKDGEAVSEISYQQWPSTDWFALYTSSRREKHVAKLLDERQIENFLPLYRADRHWDKRSPVTLDLPLFPNYLFVRAGRKASLLSVPGVLSIVGSGRQPWPLPDHEIEAFRSAVDVCKLEPHSLFAVGERVRITNGALAGMQGVLVRKKSNFRVVLTVEAIRSSVSAEVDEADLEPVNARLHTMSLGSLPAAH
jgi:transcription antitermination factor NusG